MLVSDSVAMLGPCEPTIADVIQAVFGRDWRRNAPAALGCSRRTVQRWVSTERRAPRRALVLLKRRAAAAGSDIERWKREQHQRIEEEARKRGGAAAAAVTWSQLLLIRDQREPRPRVGRPRKKSPILKVQLNPIPRLSTRGGHIP
jgi:hypothetical protein